MKMTKNGRMTPTNSHSSSYSMHMCVCAASIMLLQNGRHGMVPQGRLDSPSSYYSYSPHTQDPGQPTMVPMHPGLPNGQPPALSPAGNPHKRLKRPAMSSISSADDDVESVGEEGESLSGYYTKSAGLAQHQWQSEHVDHGKAFFASGCCCLSLPPALLVVLADPRSRLFVCLGGFYFCSILSQGKGLTLVLVSNRMRKCECVMILVI